jgi:opacity protein-like surface antigen
MACFAATAAAASAQGFLSPLLGYNFGGDSACAEISDCDQKRLNLGVSLGTMNNVLGFEEEFAYAKGFFGDGLGVSSNVITLMSNIMIVPNFGPVRPYVLGGLGLIKSHVELTPASLISFDNTHFGWDIGGGVMIFFSQHVGFRGDVRHFHSFQDFEVLGISLGDTKLDFGRASGALVFKF